MKRERGIAQKVTNYAENGTYLAWRIEHLPPTLIVFPPLHF
jgi:hypothetical protein